MLVLLVLTIALPVVGAAVALVVKERMSHYLAAAVSILTALSAGWAILRTFPGSRHYLFGGMPWIWGGAEQRNLFGVFIDPLSALMLIVITGIGVLVTIYSSEYLSPRNKEHPETEGYRRYYFWLLLFIGAMVGIALSPNLLQLFIFWELTTLCSWALISHHQDETSLRSGFKALIMTHIGGIFYLVGLFILFIFTRSFDFEALGSSALSTAMKSLVFLLFLVAAWAKAAQIPFHTWLPDAMVAPTPVSAYLHAAAMVKAGVYLIARITMASWAVPATMGLVVAGMALLTMFMALVFYFLQDDLKKLLAYSTIAHLAYILLGVSLGILGSGVAFQGGVLHIMTHGFGKSTLFLAVGAIAYATGTRKISGLGGIARALPVETAAFFVGAFTVTGVPPFACFWSKFMIFTGAVRVHGVGPVILVLALCESVVSFAWLLWVGQRVFFGPPPKRALPEDEQPVEPAPAGAAIEDPPPAIDWVLVVLMIGCLAVPLIGIPIVQAIPVP